MSPGPPAQLWEHRQKLSPQHKRGPKECDLFLRWRVPSALRAAASERRSPAPAPSPPKTDSAASLTGRSHPADAPAHVRDESRSARQEAARRWDIVETTHHRFSGLEEVFPGAAHFHLEPLVVLPQQLLILLHQPRHLIPVPLLALTQQAARVQGLLQNTVLWGSKVKLPNASRANKITRDERVIPFRSCSAAAFSEL